MSMFLTDAADLAATKLAATLCVVAGALLGLWLIERPVLGFLGGYACWLLLVLGLTWLEDKWRNSYWR